MNLPRIVTAVWRCRSAPTEELVRRAAAATLRRSQRPPGDPAPIGRIRATQRLLCGFHHPLRENAVAVLALRALGHPAQLVIGYEPVPSAGHRRLFSWIEVDGKAEGTTMPGLTFYPELWRFPVP